MKTRWRPGTGTVIGTACLVVITIAACTGPPRSAQPHSRSRGQNPGQAHGLVVRAGKYAVTLTQVSPQSLGCTKTATLVGYAVPCPTMLPAIVLGDYSLCLGTFMSPMTVGSCGGGPSVRRWMAATGGIDASGPGNTPSNDEHFVMEATPFRTTRYDVIAGGATIRASNVRVLGWAEIAGRHMRWIMVSQNAEGSDMAGHIMLVWSAGRHTYALGFHDLWGEPLNEALDVAVAQHLRMVQP